MLYLYANTFKGITIIIYSKFGTFSVMPFTILQVCIGQNAAYEILLKLQIKKQENRKHLPFKQLHLFDMHFSQKQNIINAVRCCMRSNKIHSTMAKHRVVVKSNGNIKKKLSVFDAVAVVISPGNEVQTYGISIVCVCLIILF